MKSLKEMTKLHVLYNRIFSDICTDGNDLGLRNNNGKRRSYVVIIVGFYLSHEFVRFYVGR